MSVLYFQLLWYLCFFCTCIWDFEDGSGHEFVLYFHPFRYLHLYLCLYLYHILKIFLKLKYLGCRDYIHVMDLASGHTAAVKTNLYLHLHV